MMQQQTKQTYEFGPFRLDPIKRVLLKEDEPVQLTPKAFETLLALVERRGQLLEKDELMQRLWPDSFVEEGNLTVNISTLRKALGEHRGEHRYIVTVPGRGYCFVADVREVPDEGTDLIMKAHEHTHVVIERQESLKLPLQTALISFAQFLRAHALRRWRLNRLLQTLAAVLVGLLIGGLLWRLLEQHLSGAAEDWRASLKFIRIVDVKSDRRESMNSGRLSSDGNLIVFSATSATGEGLNLWIRQINGGQPMQVTRGAWHDDSPVWSPNQQQIAFISDRNNQIGIWSVPSLGGEEPTLLKVLEPTVTVMKGGTDVQFWSKSNKLYYSWNDNVYKLDLATKEAAQITQLDSPAPLSRQFCISPDEAWIVYRDQRDQQVDLWRVSAQGGAPIRITNDSAVEQRPIWHPPGNRLIYTARLNGRFRLYQAYLDGRPPELITFTEDECYIWDVSADGSKLLYYGLRDTSDLWRLDLETKEEQQLTSEIGLEFWPQVSPDGKAMVFQALQGEYTLWEPKKSSLLVDSLPSGGRMTPLTTNAYEPQWSPDSRKIAFLRETNAQNNLFVVGSSGGEEIQATTGGVTFGGSTIGPPFNRFCTKDFCWAPDSNTIAYCSIQDGTSSLWIFSVSGSGSTKLSYSSDPQVKFTCPSWSPDGRHIAYISMPGQPGKALWSIRLADSETDELVFQTSDVLRLLGWTASGDEMVIATAEDRGMNRAFPTEVTLSRLSVAGHQRREMARISAAYLSNFHLSPDGRNISYVSTLDGRDDIWVLPVDGSGARKLTSNTDPKSYYSGLAWSPDGRHIYYGKQACWSLITMIENLK